MATILKLIPDENQTLIVAGAGWRESVVDIKKFSITENSQIAYIMGSSELVIFDDLQMESCFIPGKSLLANNIVSGMNVVIPETSNVLGFIGTYSTSRQKFNQDDVNFI